MEALQKYMEIRDIENIHRELHDIINSGYKKNDIISFLINMFSDKYISKNIWTLREMHRIIAELEQKTSHDVLMNNLINLSVLISLNTKKNLHLFSKDEKTDVREILYTANYTYFIEIEEFKHVLNEDIYNLFNIICGNTKTRRDMTKTFALINYLLACTKKEIFKIKSELDAVDYIFIILIKIIREFENELCEYVMLCKDLFYYRCKKRDKLFRINILFYCIFVLMNRTVVKQEIEYKTSVQKEVGNYDYLFIKFNYDKQHIQEINVEKEHCKINNKYYKDISCNDAFHLQDDMNIILASK